MSLSLNSEVTNGIAKITLQGELDAASAEEFRDAISAVAEQQPKRLVLIMDQLTFMASAGLRVLVFAKQKMGPNVDVYVVGAHDAVLETMEMTGFHQSVILMEQYDASTIEQI